ncbi:MAG: hypothetical protein FJ333_10840 [Sphingomonadales bacterium]|nr:hypothetical protein [Sphingomonadales bacterium]
MLGTELLNEINKLPFRKYFRGICSADTIPAKLKHKESLIINTDLSTGPGIHWYCVVRIHDVLECFDSLSVSPEKKIFLESHFNFKGLKFIAYNSTQLQPLESSLCGQYCLFYLYERYHNFDLDYSTLINEALSENVASNDQIVSQFYGELKTF